MLARTSLSKSIAGSMQGTGRDMVLIHGVGMNADYWGNLIPALTEHFRLSIIDMPGHGESPPLLATSPTLSNYTDIIAEIIKTPVIVVGHSMGALIALDLAVRYPRLINGIGVLNGIYRRSEMAMQAIKARVDQLDNNTMADSTDTLERWFGHSPTGVQAEASQQCRQWLNAMHPQHYAAAYQAFANADAPTDDQLRAIDCPALFLTGELEPNSTPIMSQAMCDLTADSKCCIVDGAKHMVSMTDGLVVEQALMTFFANGTKPDAAQP